MARRSVVGEAVIVREKYFWPDAQLNLWTLIMLITSATILGIFAQFTYIQNQMNLGVPWLFPFGISVGAIALTFILIMLVLVAQQRLLPGIMLLFSFILLVLFFAGMVGTGIQFFGSPSNINGQCQRFVRNMVQDGPSANTLAWLQQKNICDCWAAAFAFWIIGVVFIIWMIIMAIQVSRANFES